MERIELLAKIEELSVEYQMALDWGKIVSQSNDELKKIIAMIERVYQSRSFGEFLSDKK